MLFFSCVKSNCSTYSIEENEQKRLIVTISIRMKVCELSWGYQHYTICSFVSSAMTFLFAFFLFIPFILLRIGQWSLSFFFGKHYISSQLCLIWHFILIWNLVFQFLRIIFLNNFHKILFQILSFSAYETLCIKNAMRMGYQILWEHVF